MMPWEDVSTVADVSVVNPTSPHATRISRRISLCSL